MDMPRQARVGGAVSVSVSVAYAERGFFGLVQRSNQHKLESYDALKKHLVLSLNLTESFQEMERVVN